MFDHVAHAPFFIIMLSTPDVEVTRGGARGISSCLSKIFLHYVLDQ
jgi:hypothetical protein